VMEFTSDLVNNLRLADTMTTSEHGRTVRRKPLEEILGGLDIERESRESHFVVP